MLFRVLTTIYVFIIYEILMQNLDTLNPVLTIGNKLKLDMKKFDFSFKLGESFRRIGAHPAH